MFLPSIAVPARRLAPRCRGGVSSLLRLTPAGSSAKAKSWARSAAQALAPFLVTDHHDTAPLVTLLQPSPGVMQATTMV